MRDVLRILIAPLVWLAAFSAIYGLHGLICGHGITAPPPRLLLLAGYGLAVAAQVALLWALHVPRFASPSPFVSFVSHATGWVGLVATVWSLLPVAVTSYCG
ncbi:hypothetical protein [Pseudoroseicyclus tamaricis]|uniref:Uncharacterized protein n=1 Tax=Pseudoroseicyclus tamaricis TaxID=2705421 RepID=A0A6B2JSG8_9RHOB|nr:hypothetical protein [Pseudoroseicyclus tamaricis]NDV01168.1 hypothetical protein [Pseudoroseicyclus tamaricis]